MLLRTFSRTPPASPLVEFLDNFCVIPCKSTAGESRRFTVSALPRHYFPFCRASARLGEITTGQNDMAILRAGFNNKDKTPGVMKWSHANNGF